MEQKNKKIENIEKAEKVAQVIDKGVVKADEIVDNMKKKSGDLGSKIQVGLIIIVVLALVRDSGLLWTALGVFALLFLTKILGIVKKQMTPSEKQKEKSQEKIEEKK